MIECAIRHVGAGASARVLPRVRIRVRPQTTALDAAIYTPMLCMVLQGAKQVVVGDQVLRYDPATYFISSLDPPGFSRIVEASPERPFVMVSLALDTETLAGSPLDSAPETDRAAPGFAVAPVTASLLDPWRRLLRLLDTPADAPVLAPLYEREILYRLLREPQVPALRQLVRADSRLSRVREVIGWIRLHYNEPLRTERLADMAGMSVASLHRHFKTATGTSPLSFQKSLRLQQAKLQRLANETATRAAYSVGYESLSQFSREYARMFGEPPVRNARLVGAQLVDGDDFWRAVAPERNSNEFKRCSLRCHQHLLVANWVKEPASGGRGQ